MAGPSAEALGCPLFPVPKSLVRTCRTSSKVQDAQFEDASGNECEQESSPSFPTRLHRSTFAFLLTSEVNGTVDRNGRRSVSSKGRLPIPERKRGEACCLRSGWLHSERPCMHGASSIGHGRGRWPNKCARSSTSSLMRLLYLCHSGLRFVWTFSSVLLHFAVFPYFRLQSPHRRGALCITLG